MKNRNEDISESIIIQVIHSLIFKNANTENAMKGET
jgi:hypothetical protein